MLNLALDELTWFEAGLETRRNSLGGSVTDQI